MSSDSSSVETDICIVGGGPAGMMLGLLLAKVGIRVLVLEQHKDFEREYRGEVLMPRFMQMLDTLNLYQDFGEYHHIRLQAAEMFFKGKKIAEINFKEIAPESPVAIWMPQPIMLDALYQKAREFPNFDLWFNASPVSLIKEGARTKGAVVRKEGKEINVSAKLVVGADGRFSKIRKLGRFEIAYETHHFDIVWFDIPKPEGYDNTLRFFLSPIRNLLALPKYPNLIQCGLVVDKNEFTSLRKAGVVEMRKLLLMLPPLVHDFAKNLQDFQPFHVLQANLDLIKDWEDDGLLLVGDSAHTCSPVGAIGVSIAVETAIIAADVIYRCYQKNDFSKQTLNEIQTRREEDIREIHKIQNQFARFLLTKNPFLRFLLPYLLPRLFKLPAVKKTQRRLAVLPKPLSLDPVFRFEEI